MRVLCFAFVVFYFSLAHLQAQESGGIIAGKVFDEQGQPIAGAQVCVGRIEVKDEHLQVGNSSCLTKTDNSGQFRLENVPMGTVTVSANGSEGGYCGPHAPYPRVTLSAASPLANVVVNLGSKEGMVAPIVAELATGQPIFNFRVSVTVHDAERPNETRVSLVGGFSRWTTSLCVPANTDLSLEVSAKGYKAVAYPPPTPSSVPATIRLRSGERMSFQVGLSPEEKVDPNEH